MGSGIHRLTLLFSQIEDKDFKDGELKQGSNVRPNRIFTKEKLSNREPSLLLFIGGRPYRK
jgi:hypothetical protein